MLDIDPVLLLLGLSSLGLAPFFLMMVTSYVKIVVVTSLVRNALGVQQVPPNMVMNGLAIVLTIFIMAPVGMESFELLQKAEMPPTPGVSDVLHALDQASPPLRRFLEVNSQENVSTMFISTAKRIWPEKLHKHITKDNLLIAIPTFTISELTRAFQIGFVLYLAFIAIDLIISNILLAMGMMMVSPTTISLPFKLLLFVTLDGWLKISQGLLLSYH